MVIKRFIVVLLVIMLFITPILVNADGFRSSAIWAADRDARTNTNSTLWFGVGCLFNITGVGIAYIMEPSPKASSLLGKSPEYVAAYTEEYKSVGRSIQVKSALTGAIALNVVTGILIVVYYFILYSAMEGTSY